MILKTERLTIRHIVADDWKTIKEIWVDFNTSALSQYDKPHITDDADVQPRIAKWAAANSGTEHMFFAVCLDDTVIGYIAFNIRENGHEIGYCFHSAYHGKGYAKESHLALIDYMRELGIKRLTAGTAINNTPSVSLLKSLGFELIETEKVSFYKDADGNDIVFDGGVFALNLEKNCNSPDTGTVKFERATEDDAKIIIELRKQIWATTYRGIYPDNMIDEFDYAWHMEKELQRIRHSEYCVYRIVKNDCNIGYLTTRKTNVIMLQSLYLLEEYQHQGIGQLAFDFVKHYCRENKANSFILHCLPENWNARKFYEKMGGKLIGEDMDNEESWMNSVIYKFTI